MIQAQSHRRATLLALVFVAVAVAAAGCKESTAPSAASPKAPAASAPAAPAFTVDDALAAENVLLLDVRTPGEFASGHIPNATLVPVQEIEKALAVIGDKDRPVVAYCASGGRSSAATRFLREQGFTRVVNGGGVAGLARKMNVSLEK